MIPITLTRSLRGANGRNWPGLVLLDPDAPLRAAVWAQEAYEARYKLNPINLIRVRLSKRARREMELMGHEIEAHAADLERLGADWAPLRKLARTCLQDAVDIGFEDYLGGVASSLRLNLARAGQDAEGLVFDGVEQALAVPGTDLRLFGKPESFVKRRMGVALARAGDVEQARVNAKLAASKVKPRLP